MIKNVFIFSSIVLTLLSCSKEEGEGGKSSISGTISGTEISTSQSETTVITAIAGEEIKNEDYLLLNTPSPAENYIIWFNNSLEISNPPNFTNRTLIEINYTKNTSTNIDIANSIETAVNAITGSPFTVSRDNDILTISCNTKADVVDSDNGISKLVVDVTTQGENQITLQNGAFADEDVYIVYGDNDEIYDDNIKTSYDGTFKFNNLRKGSYKVFAYNKDKSSVTTPLTPVFVSIDIEGNEEGNVGTITIEKK
jgi:hypothetical protein